MPDARRQRFDPAPRPLGLLLPSVALVAAALVVAGGLVTLVGWYAGVPRLIHVVPSWPPQVANTAVMMVLGGAALVALARPPVTPSARWVGSLCAAAVCLLAGLTVVEYLFGVDLGIDQLLVRTDKGGVAGFPGRPAPHTAAAMLLAGAALLLLDRTVAGRRAVAQTLALGAASIPIVALLGYLFGVPGLYGLPRIALETGGIAFGTTIEILLLTAGILAARPDVGVAAVVTAESVGGVTARRLLLGLLAFLPLGFLATLGERLGWYGAPTLTALLVFIALVAGLTFTLLTAARIDADDARRRRAEAALLASEERARGLYEQASDGIFVSDVDGRYTDVNAAGCRMLGYTRDQIVGKVIGDFIPEEDVPRLARVRDELLQGGVQLGEWKLRRRDGSYLPVEVSANILPDGRWQAFVRDITDRKRAEAALTQERETDRRLRAELEDVTRAATAVSETAAEASEPDIMAVLRAIALEAQTLTGARYVAVGLGTDPEQPLDPWVEVGVPHHPRSVGTLGVPIRYHGQAVGNLYLADKQGAPEFSERDARLCEMLAARAAVAIETTKLRTSEALQRAWLRNIIDQMPEGVILRDPNGRPVAMNRAALALRGDDTGAVDRWGTPFVFDVRALDGRPVPFDELPVTRALEHGETVTGKEYLLAVRGGRMVPVLANAAPVRDDGGRVTGVTVLIQDITAIKELDRLREEWTSIVAHDLRQPVQAITLFAATLSRRSDELPEGDRKALERIRSASARLDRMIDDLLDASQVEAHRLSLQRRMVDLRALIESVAEGLRAETAGHSIHVLDGPAHPAWIDPDRIHQVLGNLISNAAKYGQPDSEIRIECVDHDDVVEVKVTNRGSGIPHDEMPLLFSRFRRSREARTSGTPGLGLGLYISKGLVEAHGGRLWADSVPGESTTFHFVVPARPPLADAPVHGDASPPP